MFKIVIVILLLCGATTIDCTLSDSGETLYLGLEAEFKARPNSTHITIDFANSWPNPIENFLSISLPSIMTPITRVPTVTAEGWRLSSAKVLTGATIFSQPVRVLLVEGNILALLVLEESQTLLDRRMSVLNISSYLGTTVACRDIAVDPNGYSLYVKCDELGGEFAWIVRAKLQTEEQTDTIRTMGYDGSVKISMAGCRERQLLYASRLSLSGDLLIDVLLMLCPASKRTDSSIPPLLVMKSNLENSTVEERDFGDCLSDCCDSTEVMRMASNETLILVTNTSVCSYSAGSCSEPIMRISDFRDVKIGTSTWVDDLYVLTKESLIIKYPKRTNLQRLNIREPGMDVVGFVVTKNHVYLHYKSDLSGESIMRVYTLNESIPYMAYRGPYDFSSVILEIGNYFEDVDGFFSFDTQSNSLDILYYAGRAVVLQSIVKRSTLTISNFSLILKAQSLNITVRIRLRSFETKRYDINQGKLTFSFEEQYIAVPLKAPITGPLLSFFIYQNQLSSFDYINDLNIVDLLGAFPSRATLANLVGFRFRSDEDDYYLEFFSRAARNDPSVVDYHTCLLEYKHDMRHYEVARCISAVDARFTSKLLREVAAFVVIPAVGSTQLVRYAIHDDRNLMLCDQAGQCQPKIFVNLTESIQEVKAAGDGLLLMLVDNRKVLRLYTLHNYSASPEQMLLELGKAKLPDLADPSVVIRSFETDPGFKEVLVVLLSNSMVYILQRNNDGRNLLYLCHITSKLSPTEGCTACEGVHLFKIDKAYRLVLICPEQNAILEYTMLNPFSIRYSRNYPLFDYRMQGCHFSDSSYLYVQTQKNNRLYYLVFDPAEITANMPSTKIEVWQLCPRTIRGYTEQGTDRGLGIIGNQIYAYSGVQLISRVSNATSTSFMMGVQNEIGQNSIIEYKVEIDLSSSEIGYDGKLPSIALDLAQSSQAVLELSPKSLWGPIERYEIHSNCSQLVSISKLQTVERYECLAKYGEYGRLLTFISLQEENAEVVVTSQYLLCVQEHRVRFKLRANQSSCNSLQQFRRSDQSTHLLMACQNEGLVLLEVGSDCQLASRPVPIELVDYSYYDFKAGYPYLLLEVPILLPENRDYYCCVFSQPLQSFVNCSVLVNAELQSNFRSVDFDTNSEFALLLERGIGVFELGRSSSGVLAAVYWLTEADLEQQLNVRPPFAYIQLVSSSLATGELIFELATRSESYEVNLTLSTSKLRKVHTYNKYVNCFYSRESKPSKSQEYHLKTCDFSPPNKYVVSNLVPIVQKVPSKLLQVFLKAGAQSWPGLMIELSSASTVSFNRGFMIVSDPTSLLCYDKINQALAWRISHEPLAEDDVTPQNCTAWVTLQNSYLSKNINFTLELKRKPSQELDIAVWVVRVLATGSIILFFVVQRCSSATDAMKKQALRRIQTRILIRKGFDEQMGMLQSRRRMR